MITYTIHEKRNMYDRIGLFHTSMVTNVKSIERSVNRVGRNI